MALLHRPVTLSHAAYEVLWERAELGLMPAPISINYPLRSPDNGARLARQARAELNHDDLARGDDIDPRLSNALRLLASAPRRYYALCLSEAEPHGRGPLVALDGQHAVLAALDDHALRLWPVGAAGAIAALVSRLPPNRPGNGATLSFRADELGPDGTPVRAGAAAGSVLVPTREAHGDAHRYAALAARGRTAMIYCYSVVDGRRCEHPMIALDVAHDGRWLTTRQRGRDGTEWITATPASPATLVERLSTLR